VKDLGEPRDVSRPLATIIARLARFLIKPHHLPVANAGQVIPR